MNTTANKTSYSPTFQSYLDNTFTPAQNWALSDEGTLWITTHIPSLKKLIDEQYDDCLFACYCIYLNGNPLYTGESIRAIRRLCVHAYNIAHHPELFGLEEKELDINAINAEILETGIYGDALRKRTEMHYIKTLKPLLQRSDGTDRCIPKIKRRNAVLPYLHKVVV